jgi:hypothetical protein
MGMGLSRITAQMTAAIVALAAGGAIAIMASAGPTPARAAEQVSVQAFTVPSSAYSAPLASAELPMAVNPSGTGDWVLVSGSAGATLLNEPTTGGPPNVLATGIDDNSGHSPYLSLVASAGKLAYAWSEADSYQMLGLTSSGTPIQLTGVAKALASGFKPDARDMTGDASGNLYIPDNAGKDITRANFQSINGSQPSLPSSFTTPKPDAVAFVGGKLWFTTDSGQLGSMSPTATDYTSGPDGAVSVNGNGHTLAAGPDGNL